MRKAEEKILEEVEPVEPKLGKVDEKIENIGEKEAVVANKIEENKYTISSYTTFLLFQHAITI